MNKNNHTFNKRMKDYFEDRKLTKISIFIIVTFTLLYAIFVLIGNLTSVVPTVGNAISWFLGLFTTFFIGLVLAYIINPLVDFIGRKTHLKRGPSVLITYLIIVAAIALILYGMMALVLGKLVIGNIPDLVNTLTETAKSYIASIQKWAASLPGDAVSNIVQKVVSKITDWVSDFFSGGSVISTATGFAGGILNFVIGVIFSIYLLLDKDYFIGQWNKFLDMFFPKRKEPLNGTLNEIHDILTKFIKGIAIDAMIVAILTSIGLTIVGVEFAVFLGLFAGICNVIQYFGPFIGMVPAFFVALMTMDLTHAIIAVAVMFVIQQFDANLIYPKVVGGSTGLHPLLVLLAVTVGGGIAGLVGMIIGVPVASIIKLLATKWLDRETEKKEAELQTAAAEQTDGAQAAAVISDEQVISPDPEDDSRSETTETSATSQAEPEEDDDNK